MTISPDRLISESVGQVIADTVAGSDSKRGFYELLLVIVAAGTHQGTQQFCARIFNNLQWRSREDSNL
jgi:hypothetical protein